MSDETQAPRQAQDREEEDPTERERPIPIVVALITLSVVIFGVVYIMLSEPFGRPDLGDRRTVADLRAPAAGAAGAAANGKQVFTVNCVACHQATGKGLPGVFPPLDGSEWVAGDERIVANILLHGINGEITVAGNSFKGAMPAFHQLSDAELAAVASYVRSEWSNKATPIKAEVFATERKANPRTTPFNGGAELNTLKAKAS